MQKGLRVDRVKNSLWEESELLRRLPEIDMIEHDESRQAVIDTFIQGCADYFWKIPSSSSGKYHSDDECGPHGNWIHTKRVFRAYTDISESYIEAGAITEEEREFGKAAALIHDMMKQGWPSENNNHTVDNHDLIAAEVALEVGEAPAEIASLIESHMGPWGDGPLPATQNEWLLHNADKFVTSTPADEIAIYHPTEEILQVAPQIKQA